MDNDSKTQMIPPWLRQVDSVARTTAQSAGKMVKAALDTDISSTLLQESASKSTSIDIVTKSDKESEELIISTLSKAFPDFGFLGEETGMSFHLDAPYIWVIDPIDGTTSYAHKHIYWCISIALVKNQDTTNSKYHIDDNIKIGQPIYGCIYSPFLHETYSAIRGDGAYLHTPIKSQKMSVSTNSTLITALIASGFPYDRKTSKMNNLDYFTQIITEIQGFRRCGAAALDLAFIACGRLDGYWELKLGTWDVAAGNIIIQEAGGTCTMMNGDPVCALNVNRKVNFAAGNPKIQPLLLNQFKIVDKQRGTDSEGAIVN